ncbi:hypothetical protein [Demequina aurantiaca]|uniref:hypothetical protein n=1 Tax=Demequina aurantiaca TaxID=676200 RepID=UPI0007819EA7|nr:hypothetical protein [Demequina aurantiaca]
MSHNDDLYVVVDANATPDYFPKAPLYLPLFPLMAALDSIDTALRDLQMASVMGWQSVLADTYRGELDDLTRDVTLLRNHVHEADRLYRHLRFVAHMNGE